MSLLLTTPFSYDPGHGRPVEVSNEVKIVFFSLDVEHKSLCMRIKYGNTVDGQWIGSTEEARQLMLEDRDAHIGPSGNVEADLAFSALVGTTKTTAADVLLYNEVSDSLYQYLIDRGEYAGTIQ